VSIAYLINQYPQTSHTFIRREIRALEERGIEVLRYTVRASDHASLVDAHDKEEAARARVILGAGPLGLLGATLKTLFTRPGRFFSALRLAWLTGKVSTRGQMISLIYLAEACVLLGWLRRDGVSHVHAHFGTNSAAVAMLCRVLGGPPYSFTCHGPEEFDMPVSLSLGEKINHAAFVVAISEFGRSQLFRWCPHEQWEKIHIVRCGVDRSFLSAPAAPCPAIPRLVCVGRLSEQKGQLALVEAAGRLKSEGLKFEVALVGDGRMRGALEQAIDRLNLRDIVKLLGWRDSEGVRRELANSRALVLPSFAEGLPVVVMESFAVGRPVLSTSVAGIPELVEPSVSGWLVPPGSVDRLAAAMKQVLQAPPEELDRMGNAGKAKVAEKHDVNTEAAKLASLFPQTAQQTSPDPALSSLAQGRAKEMRLPSQ